MGIGLVSSDIGDVTNELVKLNIDFGQANKSSLWFVYHRDLKENQRIKAFLAFFKTTLNVVLTSASIDSTLFASPSTRLDSLCW